jgi:hypothetical protein
MKQKHITAFSRFTAGVLSACMIYMLVLPAHTGAQTRNLSYQILHGSNQVGTVQVTETRAPGITNLKMESQVKGRVLLISYSGSATEEAVYQNGTLVNSSIYRKMNGKEKANRKHIAMGDQYIIQSGNDKSFTSQYPITYNMLSLYTTEPVNQYKVYSDNFQRFLDIKKLEEHKYKIELPDGKTNYYHYKDGLLVMVEAHSTWYSVKIVLKS